MTGTLLLVGVGVTLQSTRAPAGDAHWIGAALAVLGVLLSLRSRNTAVRSIAYTVAALCVLNAAAGVGPPPGPNPVLVAEGAQALAAVEPSVVKVRSEAAQCNQSIEGSGFVYETGRVITNAHVVAGTGTVQVETSQGTWPATVIFYDPDVDIAVLSVPELMAKPLTFASAAKSGDHAIVLGYPDDDPFTSAPAVIGKLQPFTAPNIYGAQTRSRAVYSITATVLNGDSGGPLVTPDGQVLGVVFAKALDSTDTGFVLTNDEIKDDLNTASTAPLNPATPITGNCSTS